MESLESFLENRIFAPLNKSDTHCYLPKNKRHRLATVYGYFTEMGSIYTSDIAAVEVNGIMEPLEQTPAQKKKSDKTALLMKGLFGG